MPIWTKLQLWSARRSLARLQHKIVLTYDNKRSTDGVGAQLQRILGIYAVSRLLNLNYFHSPILYVDYQGFSAIGKNNLNPHFHEEFNDLFAIESDVSVTDDFQQITMLDLSLERVHQLVRAINRGDTPHQPVLLRLGLPYGIADKFPDCYDICKRISPFASKLRKDGTLRVAIHVRRGDLITAAPERILPNSYYINVCRGVTGLLHALDMPYDLELHTELPMQESVVVTDKVVPQLTGNADSCLADFGVLPNVHYHINERAMDCLRSLATADIIVLSRSSFSYVAALLNKNGIVLYYPFWHRPLSSWIPVREDGQFDEGKLRKAIQIRGQSGVARAETGLPGNFSVQIQL